VGDHQPGAGVAELAGVDVDLAGLCGGRVEVAVGEHEDGRLPAELEHDRLDVLCRGAHHRAPGLDRAGEGEAVDVGVARERRAGDFPESVDDVDGAVGQAGLGGDLGELEGADGRLLGGLDDGGASSGERRGDPPHQHAQGHVPGDDVRGHPEGLADRAFEESGTGRDLASLDLVGEARVVVEVIDAPGDGRPRVGQRLAGVGDLDRHQVVEPLPDPFAEAEQDAHALGRGHLAPASLECAAGRLDGGVDFLLACRADFRYGLAVRRVDREDAIPVGFDPFAADVQAGLR